VRGWTPAVLMVVALLAAVGGWAAGRGAGDPPALPVASPSGTAVRDHAAGRVPRRHRGRLPRRPAPFPSAADRASFRRLEHSLGGSSGVAVAAVGGSSPIAALGGWRSGVAWSTIKPVVAMAVTAARIDDTQARADMRLAITSSDNAAAERLWRRLGDDATAAAATGDQLVALGDHATRVPSQRLRPEFTVFGQTTWSLARQVRATAAMPCLPAGRRVLALMRDIAADQRWGLGSLGRPAAFKGGWGPDPAGAYLVRQTGVLELDGRQIAVALASRPADGSFASGIRNIGVLARWMARRAAGRVPATRGCGR
jgi:hypothetical protein